MENAIFQGISHAFAFGTLALTCLGTIGGIIVGAIPGLTATMAVAVLLPFTFNMNPMDGLAMLCGVYVGGVYGGSISAILLRIPGTPSAIMTTKDGYPLAQKGEGGRAIGIATFAAFTGGMISVILMIIAGKPIADIALQFAAPEFFALALWGLSTVADVSGESLLYGLIAAALGVFVGTIGADPVSGILRFTAGSQNLSSGIDFVAVMIGLFGLSEVLRQFGKDLNEKNNYKIGRVLPSMGDIRKIFKTIMRGTAIGFWVGVLPGATGGGMASIISYNAEVKASQDPESYGKGRIEGVAAAESGASSSVGGNMIPLLTLGIPGDTVTALLIGAFTMHNIQPGPMLYAHKPDLVYGLYTSMVLAYISMFFIGISCAGFLARTISIPKRILVPIIVILCATGAYAVNGSIFDVYVMLFFGLAGYIMEDIGFSLNAFVMGLVLGPMAESSLRTALIMTEGNIAPLFTRPLAAAFWILIFVQIIYPKLRDFFKKDTCNSAAS